MIARFSLLCAVLAAVSACASEMPLRVDLRFDSERQTIRSTIENTSTTEQQLWPAPDHRLGAISGVYLFFVEPIRPDTEGGPLTPIQKESSAESAPVRMKSLGTQVSVSIEAPVSEYIRYAEECKGGPLRDGTLLRFEQVVFVDAKLDLNRALVKTTPWLRFEGGRLIPSDVPVKERSGRDWKGNDGIKYPAREAIR